MIGRFMNWLLHQLQKLLGAISRRRINPPPSSPIQDRLDVNLPANHRSTPVDDSHASTLEEPSVSLTSQVSDSSVLQPTDSQKDTVQLAVENADGVFDSYMRLDATASTIPPSDDILAGSEFVPSDRPSLTQPAIDNQSAAQLPSIHDLLPAVEQEIKTNSASLSEEKSSAESNPLPSDSFSLETDHSEETGSPEQALLFSFEIIESPADEEVGMATEDSNSPIAQNTTESDFEPDALALTVPTDNLNSEDNQTSIIEDTQSPDLTQPPKEDIATEVSTTTLKEEPVSSSPELSSPGLSSPELNELDKASLPYPWSITASNTELSSKDDAAKSQTKDSSPEPSQSEPDETIEREFAETTSDSDPNAPTQPAPADYPVKNGIVKLLFTMKEGNFHGYIEPNDGTSDILFHQKYINEDIFDSLERGVEVVVSVKYMEGKAYATQVDLAE